MLLLVFGHWAVNKISDHNAQREINIISASKLLIKTSNQYYQQEKGYTDDLVSLAAVNPQLATLKGIIKIELSSDKQAVVIRYKLSSDAPEETTFVLSDGKQVK